MSTATGYGIPSTWQPNAGHVELAKACGVDLAVEEAAFRSFDRDEPIRNVDRAFTGWLRHAKPAAEEAKPKPKAGGPLQRIRAEIDAFRKSNPEEFERLRAYLVGHKWWAKSNASFQLEQMREAIVQRKRIFAYLDGTPPSIHDPEGE